MLMTAKSEKFYPGEVQEIMFDGGHYYYEVSIQDNAGYECGTEPFETLHEANDFIEKYAEGITQYVK
jgi:hypothetical protein